MDGEIKSPDGVHRIPMLPHVPESFLHKNTLIFGGTNSGKSTIVYDILHILQNSVPNIIVIVPESSRSSYADKLPDICIKNDLTKELLDSIWTRQETARKIYNTVNDDEKLFKLASSVNSLSFNRDIEAIKLAVQKQHSVIDEKYLDPAERSEKKALLDDAFKKRSKSLCRKCINENKDKLLQSKDPDTLMIIKCLNFNPNFLLVIDDCSEKLKSWQKLYRNNETNIFDSIFFRGRHVFISSIIVGHDDKFLSPELRKGARLVIYTQSQIFMGAISKDAAGMTKKERSDAEVISPLVFKDDARVMSLKKICYEREATPPFKYFIATKHEKFRLCSNIVWELSSKVPKKDESIDGKTLNNLLGTNRTGIKW